MPLITQRTALNKIKFGADRYGAGIGEGSNQPYIRRDIPGVNVDDPNPTMVVDVNNDTGEINYGDLPAKTGVDFLIRNGFRAPADAIRDVSRLFKMFTDLKSPNGLLFTAAQNILSRTAVKTEASYGIGYGRNKEPDFLTGEGGGALNEGIYTPLSTLAQAAVGFAGGHLNLMGLDPTSPMSGVIEGGLFPGAGLRTYMQTIKEKNADATFSTQKVTRTFARPNPNYTADLLLPFIGGRNDNPTTEPPVLFYDREVIVPNDQTEFSNRLVEILEKKQNVKPENIDQDVIVYNGGPGSILGIGKTRIKFASGNLGGVQRTGINSALYAKDPNFFFGTVINKDKYKQGGVEWSSLLGASISAKSIFTGNDKVEIEEDSTNPVLSRINNVQSTIRNAELVTLGFFTDDPNVSPNDYSVFQRTSGTVSSLSTKKNIFSTGASVQFISSFPESQDAIYEELNTDTDGGIYNFDNNVYEENLVTIGKDAQGKAYANNTLTFTQAQLEAQEQGAPKHSPQVQDFRKTIIESNPDEFEGEQSSIISLAPNYVTKGANRRVNRGDPGKSNTANGFKNVYNYGLDALQMEALDKINAQPMYDGTGPNTTLAVNDFCKFRIAAINNDSTDGSAVYMHFRAFIDSFNDNYNASWEPVKYAGRGENLYNYAGFDRQINLSFTCMAQSKAELIPMYKKLNYLASTLAPDYTNAGFMRGNLVRLTLGGYLYEQPGFITSLTYDIPQEAPWEIAINAEGGGDGSVKELPHMIKVSNLLFTPIHRFLPQKPNDANNPDEKYIALANALGSQGNYSDLYPELLADGDGDNNNQNNILGE